MDSDNKTYYVTEGMLRAIHRHELPNDTTSNIIGSINRSFSKKDSKQLKKNGQTTIKIEMQPISYMFKKGNRIGIYLTGVDIGSFDTSEMQGYEDPQMWQIFCNSKLILPVVYDKRDKKKNK